MKQCILALALAVAACGPVISPCQIAQADARLAHIEQGYVAARAFAALFLPMLPDAQRARVEAAEVLVERALTGARLAVTVADRAAAIGQAQDALAHFTLITGG